MEPALSVDGAAISRPMDKALLPRTARPDLWILFRMRRGADDHQHGAHQDADIHPRPVRDVAEIISIPLNDLVSRIGGAARSRPAQAGCRVGRDAML